MPKIYVDIAFGRGTTNPVMYSLPLDKSNKSMHENNLFVAISDRAPRRLVGEGWKADPVSGEVNGGWLYHGVLKGYPRSRNFPHSLSDMQVAVKWVRGQRAIESLRREARMYDDVLRPLQGTVVPTFYGFFAGRKDGIDVGCMLLEWCPGNDPATSGKPTEEVIRMQSLAVKSLHEAGVYHGQLYERGHALSVSDGRHFLRAEGGTMRIVDFQQARMHSCKGYREEHFNADGYRHDGGKCKELALAMEHRRRCAEGELKNVPWDMF